MPPGFSGVLGPGGDLLSQLGGVGGGKGFEAAGVVGTRGGEKGLPPSLEIASKIATTPMDFSSLGKGSPHLLVPVPKKFAGGLMTPENKRVVEMQSGAEVEWALETKAGPQAMVRGSTEQVRLASKLLESVKTHCKWGCTQDKIRRLLKPTIIEKALCRLAPMDTLISCEKVLSATQPRLSVGKGKDNDAVITDVGISRRHCFLELNPTKGSIFIADCSTNGTFLNGVRLPARKLGKVLVSHGDELTFRDPSSGQAEFGYIVNITEIQVKPEVQLSAPRRILSQEQASNDGRDLR